MKCPNCNCDLLMSERMGIEVDYCPSCRGVWLDRGELDKFIAQAERPALPERPASSYYDEDSDDSFSQRKSYDDDRGRSHYPRGKKRESLWSKLFDFD